MMNLTLSNEKIYTGSLLLVNAEYPIQDFGEEKLLPVTEDSEIRMKREAVYILRLIFEKIDCFDSIVPVSGYRSVKEQADIYEASLQDNGEDFTRKFVAFPYHSEHQTGLAVDLGLKKEEIDFICPDFPYEGICHRFRQEAPRYGFVERYPKGREEVTGIAHEPWHFRYVGYPHSEIMSTKNLTLEEYITFIRQFPYTGKHLKWSKEGREMEIFYVPAGTAGNTRIQLPDDICYQVSGNNVDGFVLTLQCKSV